MKTLSLALSIPLLLIATLGFVASPAEAAVEPIWLSGKTNLSKQKMLISSTLKIPVIVAKVRFINPKIKYYLTICIVATDYLEDFSAPKGAWATIEVGTGSRGEAFPVIMDSKGTLWIFGGTRNTGSPQYLFAVWNYNPKTDQYRWVWNSEMTNPRNPGELGVPAETNHPGGLAFTGAVIDNNDNIWFTSYIYPGELWMFNTTSWTFVRVQGLAETETKTLSIGANPGQPGEDVWPGYVEGQCMVLDSQNNLWMLTGFNVDVTNTVWHFNMTSKLWTFISGDITASTDPHNTTYFGGAWGIGCDIDDNDRVWIYGGWGYYAPSYDRDDYGNMWTYDTRVKREWEFESGGEYTLKRPPQVVSDDYSADNYPGASDNSLLIDRLDGTLMLLPGGSYNARDGEWTQSDEVWLYSKSLKQWKLVHGNISAPIGYGVYSNYREPGSVYPHSLYFGRQSSRNFYGDALIVGGGSYDDDWWRKDMWIIPQDQCANNLHNCDINADCVEEMVGFSCACKEGYSGDGVTCTDAEPVASPMTSSPESAAPVANAPVSVNTPKTSSATSVFGSLLFLVSAALIQ